VKISLLCVLIIMGCGQKGDLVRPQVDKSIQAQDESEKKHEE